jgi:hypothetical protein
LSTAHDRRDFLRRAGLGAAAAGAWVAPQVLSTSTASAACTPVCKLLQVTTGCAPASTNVNGNLPGCVPSCQSGVAGSWASGPNDLVGFSCTPAPGGNSKGATITIANGCTPADAKAVKQCSASGGLVTYSCVSGSISGQVVTFPTITDPQCFYDAYRITVTCCI